MKSIILIALAVGAVALAAPGVEPPKIVRFEYDQQPSGNYLYNFETDDGTKQSQKGVLKDVVDEDNKPRTIIAVSGSYGFINDQGKPEQIEYTADENGYQAVGSSIPVAPVARR